MPDEKLMKVVLEARNALEKRPYAEAIEAATRSSLPLADALRTIEQNSGIRQMLESIKHTEALTRTALAPIEEMRRAGIFDIDSSWRSAMECARQAMEGFDARFLLPEMTETTRLLAEFKASPFSEVVTRYADETSGLQRAIESMETPWLDVQEKMRSIASFAELQGIGHALRSMSAFDENLSAALRLDLGDWRDPITWRPEIFTDLTARSDFYVSLGFNPALTDFPLMAFEQSLDIAGLHRELPPLVEGYGASMPSRDRDEEEGLMRTNAAHDRLQRLERMVRKFIDEHMTQAFGSDWPRHRLPNGLYEQWLDKKRNLEQGGPDKRPLIEYSNFTDYMQVICRADNWREIFAPFFSRSESVRESFQRLHPIRLDIAHSRIITKDDELLLRVEVTRLVKVIVFKGGN